MLEICNLLMLLMQDRKPSKPVLCCTDILSNVGSFQKDSSAAQHDPDPFVCVCD